MRYQKRIYVIGATVLLCFVVLEFVVTAYNTSPRHLYNISPYPTFKQYGGFYPDVKNVIQLENRLTKSKEKFDFQRLQEKFKNETCPIRKLTWMTRKSNKRALLSFPASGNTWTRHLIEQITGFHTCAANTKGKVSIESTIDTDCVVYKSHSSTPLVLAPFNKAVIIIRDPLYALKSYFHYKFGEQKDKPLSARGAIERHKGYAEASLFLSPKWTSHVESQLARWRNSYISWLKHYNRNCMIVVYENLKQNVVPELLQIVRYLRIHPTPRDMWCTLVNKEGKAHRITRNETSVFSLFTAKQKEKVLKSVCEVSKVARNLDIDLDISQYLVNLTETPSTACL